MFAEMDRGMGDKRFPQPNVKRQIAMRRRQGWVMMGFVRVQLISPAWLHADGGSAVAAEVDCESLGRRIEKRIGFRLPPAIFDLCSGLCGNVVVGG